MSGTSFAIPEHLLQASLARQAKLKEKVDGRKSTSPSVSPKPSRHHLVAAHATESTNPLSSLTGASAASSRDPSPHKYGIHAQHHKVAANSLHYSHGHATAQHISSDGAPTQQQQQSSSSAAAAAASPFLSKEEALAALQKPAPLLTSPSKTAVAVEKMKQKREERRRKQAEVKKMKEGLTDGDIEVVMFNQILTDFRKRIGYDPKQAAKKGQTEPIKDVRIRVCIRKRPLFNKEAQKGHFDITTAIPGAFPNAIVHLHEPKTKLDMTKSMDHHQFAFDNVFAETSSNHQVYLQTAKPLVQSIFKEGRATFFCYGQTGSGKTFTIFGPDKGHAGTDPENRGIYEYACTDCFALLNSKEYAPLKLTLHICFFEIYGGRIYDLFNNRERLNMLEDKSGNVQIAGLKEVHVTSPEQMMKLMQTGHLARTTGATEANPESSRSHAIFQIVLRNKPADHASDGGFGKLSLIDLAGNERGIDTGPHLSRQARLEGAEINKSLLALKECIRAINKNPGGHIPFRASKLTLALRDSFVGKLSRTVMIGTVSPGSNAVEHSLNTLRYADRVKEFKGGSGSGAESKVTVKVKKLEELVGDAAAAAAANTSGSNPSSIHRLGSNYSLHDSDGDFLDDDDDDDDDIYQDSQDRLGELEVNGSEDGPLPPQAKRAQGHQHTRQASDYSDVYKSFENFTIHEAARPYALSLDNLETEKEQQALLDSPVEDTFRGDYHQDLDDVMTRTLGHESTEELMSLHETISRLLEEEDALYQAHRQVRENMSAYDRTEDKLLQMVGKPEYDIDTYTNGLEDVLISRIEDLSNLYTRLKQFKERLSEEEAVSRRVHGLPNY